MSIVRSAQYSTDKLGSGPHNAANNTTAPGLQRRQESRRREHVRSRVIAIVTLTQNGLRRAILSAKVKDHERRYVTDRSAQSTSTSAALNDTQRNLPYN